MKVAVIHGPNLNMLGKRQPEIYGKKTLDEINRELHEKAQQLGVKLECFQSNHEGAIVDFIQGLRDDADGIIINAAAYTHTSIAIRDALLTCGLPFIEVHLSNIFSRDPFRHRSMLSDIATGVICGFGALSYELALEAIVSLIKAQAQV